MTCLITTDGNRNTRLDGPLLRWWPWWGLLINKNFLLLEKEWFGFFQRCSQFPFFFYCYPPHPLPFLAFVQFSYVCFSVFNDRIKISEKTAGCEHSEIDLQYFVECGTANQRNILWSEFTHQLEQWWKPCEILWIFYWCLCEISTLHTDQLLELYAQFHLHNIDQVDYWRHYKSLPSQNYKEKQFNSLCILSNK